MCYDGGRGRFIMEIYLQVWHLLLWHSVNIGIIQPTYLSLEIDTCCPPSWMCFSSRNGGRRCVGPSCMTCLQNRDTLCCVCVLAVCRRPETGGIF